MTADSEAGRRERRLARELSIDGTAVIAMGAWSVLKLITRILVERQRLFDVAAEGDMPAAVLWPIIAVFVLVVGGVIMAFHLYIGASARMEAKSGSHLPFYLLLSGVFAFLFAQTALVHLFDGAQENETASAIIDLTVIYALVNVIVSARRLRRIRRADADGGR